MLGKVPHKINDFLYLGDYSSATSSLILELGIGYVVNASGFENKFQNEGVRYININLWDSPTSDIKQHFDATSDFIENARIANGRVLVHCAAGISRSTSILLAYMMKKERIDLRTAFLHVKKIRTIVQPNPGFALQLIEYEREVLGKVSVLPPTGVQRNSHFGLAELIKRELQESGHLDDHTKEILKDEF